MRLLLLICSVASHMPEEPAHSLACPSLIMWMSSLQNRVWGLLMLLPPNCEMKKIMKEQGQPKAN